MVGALPAAPFVSHLGKSQPLLRDYLKRASNSPDQIRLWHHYWNSRLGKEPWWGVAPALSRLVFADIDVKEGKCGQNTYDLFKLLYGWPETLESRSPSGGMHLWYEGKPLFHVGTLKSRHPHIDFAQYVIVPGCGGYRLFKKQPIAPAPWWFYVEGAKRSQRDTPGRTRPERLGVEQEPVVELDQQGNIDWAIGYLKVDAPWSIYKECGDSTTVQVAATLKDHGISRPRALELMKEHYNKQKCTPPWRTDDAAPAKDSLSAKVRGAFTYLTDKAPGHDTAEFEFADPSDPLTDADKRAAARERKHRLRREADYTVPPLLAPKKKKECVV
jgi:hypothetical protein